jgi:hypothetical protein
MNICSENFQEKAQNIFKSYMINLVINDTQYDSIDMKLQNQQT